MEPLNTSDGERHSAATVRAVGTDHERDACYRIRETVFVEEQKVPPWEELDSEDETADHFLAELDGEIVGTARLVDKGGGIGKIGRVAVLAACRSRGIGRELVLQVIDVGFRRYDTLILDAQISAIPFYERLGFVAEGEVFLDARLEHRRMRRERPPGWAPRCVRPAS